MPDADLPTLAACEAVAGPAAGWATRCHEVALKINAGLALGWREVYGMYTGRVKPGGPFDPARPAQRHGWLVTPAGRVFDPTRWVFERRPPYLYVGPPPCPCPGFEPDGEHDDLRCLYCRHVPEEHDRSAGWFGECRAGAAEYDAGMEAFKSAYRTPPPAAAPGAELVDFRVDRPDVVVRLVGYFPAYPLLTVEQIRWVANLGPRELGPAAKPVYERVTALGHGAAIPLDYRVAVLGGGRY